MTVEELFRLPKQRWRASRRELLSSAPALGPEVQAVMYTPESLLDVHERAHRSLRALLVHCRGLTPAELDRGIEGFGYASIRLQLHHEIGAEEYWIGVLQGRIHADENDAAYPDVASLEAYRERVYAATRAYLQGASIETLNAARPMRTWNGREPTLVPAHVILRTATHLYHHQGQMVAMSRMMGKPVEPGLLDFPLAV